MFLKVHYLYRNQNSCLYSLKINFREVNNLQVDFLFKTTVFLISATLSRLLIVEGVVRFCVSLCSLCVAGCVLLSNKVGLTILRPC